MPLRNPIKRTFPKTFAIMIWYQTWALPDQAGESAFMTDPAVITLANLKFLLTAAYPNTAQ